MSEVQKVFVLNGSPTIQETITDGCPMCGNELAVQVFGSMPYINIPSLKLSVVAGCCEKCGIDLTMVKVEIEGELYIIPPDELDNSGLIH